MAGKRRGLAGGLGILGGWRGLEEHKRGVQLDRWRDRRDLHVW